jgi:hypothetical protein
MTQSDRQHEVLLADDDDADPALITEAFHAHRLDQLDVGLLACTGQHRVPTGGVQLARRCA